MRYESDAALLAASERLLAKWQSILLLQDWDIRLRIARDIDDLNAVARTHPSTQQRRAIVEIDASYWVDGKGADEKDKPLAHDEFVDFEAVFVHEMMHVRHAELDRETDTLARDASSDIRVEYEHEKERFTSMMARILLRLESSKSSFTFGSSNAVVFDRQLMGTP